MAAELPDFAFIGKAGAGKTTASDMLVGYFHYTPFSFATPLKTIAGQLWGEKARKDRDKLQRLGVAVREIEQDTWVNLLLKDRENLVPDGPVVVDDCRFENEFTALGAAGFVFIRIEAPREQRIDRLRANGKLTDEAQLDHVSETALDHVTPDFVIWNDEPNNADQFLEQIISILNREARRV